MALTCASAVRRVAQVREVVCAVYGREKGDRELGRNESALNGREGRVDFGEDGCKDEQQCEEGLSASRVSHLDCGRGVLALDAPNPRSCFNCRG